MLAGGLGGLGYVGYNFWSDRFGAAPDFYVVASSAPLDAMLDPQEDVRFRISPHLAIRALSGGQENVGVPCTSEASASMASSSTRFS